MAQAVAPAMAPVLNATGSASQTAALAADELRELREYDKIVQFRDLILTGNHSRVKAPAPSMGNGQSSALPTSSTNQGLQNGAVLSYQQGNLQSFRANSQQPAVAALAAGSSATDMSATKRFGSGATEIDPLLLTKSDELIKAELQLQRQRLERSLRDEVDQRRAVYKANGHAADYLSDFDLSDVLAKALTLVQATAPPAPVETDVAANPSDSCDSFDENSFYSSQHDTPEPHISPKAHNAPVVARAQNTSSSSARPNFPDTAQLLPAPNVASSRAQEERSRPPPSGGISLLGQVPARETAHAQVISSNGSGATSRSGSGNGGRHTRRHDNRLQASHQVLSVGQFAHREQPLIRAHDLSPFAPQAAHVSPLATARQQPMHNTELGILQGTPAQVTALRQEPVNGTSPESSPQGEKGSKKKNHKKKNKMKAAELRAMECPASPYIKPEPHSPSLLSAPPNARPNKRQRPLHRYQPELIYDEPRQPIEIAHQEEYAPSSYQGERAPAGYERTYDSYARPLRESIAPSSHGLERAICEERRPEETVQYVRRVQSPGYAMQYAPSEIRPMRSTTYSTADPFPWDGPSYYPEGRMSVRPVADRARSRSPVTVEPRPSIMGPPRAPSRIVRDQYGREYIEPPPPSAASRHSIAPAGRLAEPEIIYDRAPVRSTSRMPGPDTFERDGVIYRRASPTLVPRRVITEPEYGAVDYRDYRQRDYSTQPLAHASGHEYVQYRGVAERFPERLPEETQRDYTRAASVRPADHIHYEHRSMQGARPDVPVREYTSSVHPESRREVAPHVVREFSARPADSPGLPRREFSTRPVERYYERPMVQDEALAYIERPRTVQREIVYEDGRREVYR